MMIKANVNADQLKRALMAGGLEKLQLKIADEVTDEGEKLFIEALKHWGQPERSTTRGNVRGSKNVNVKFTRKNSERINTEVFVINDILYFVSEGTRVNWTKPDSGYVRGSSFTTHKWGPRIGTVSFTNNPNPGLDARKLDFLIADELRDNLSQILNTLK